MSHEDWHVSDPGAVVESGTGTDGVPGDICPQGFEPDFDRASMSTHVLLNRVQPAEIPGLKYTYSGTTSAPPTSGQLRLNNADQTLATVAYVHKTDANGNLAYHWLRYLIDDSSIRITAFTDSILQRGYRVTGTVTETTNYFAIPIAWEDGTNPVPTGDTYLYLLLRPEPPSLYIDAAGEEVYGPIVFRRLDLINNSRDLFETLADQILEVRGINSVPRIEAITIDARTNQTFPTHNADLMSSCRPETPSRFQVRLQADEDRMIFDRMCFASNIRHSISRSEWTLRIGLDIAEWAAT